MWLFAHMAIDLCLIHVVDNLDTYCMSIHQTHVWTLFTFFFPSYHHPYLHDLFGWRAEWTLVSPAVSPPILGCDEFERLSLVIVSLAELLVCLWTGPSRLCCGVQLGALESSMAVSHWCRKKREKKGMGIMWLHEWENKELSIQSDSKWNWFKAGILSVLCDSVWKMVQQEFDFNS